MNADLFGNAIPERMTANDCPQTRYGKFGACALSDRELIALQLTGSPDETMAAAGRLLNASGTLQGLASFGPAEFARHGITKQKAFALAGLAEIARRMMQEQTPAPMLNRAELVYAHLRPLALGLDVEKFWVLCLNRKNRLIRCEAVTSGTATAALAHPREVFRLAIRESATAVICAHNHPSGDPAPSAADLHLTRQLREAAKAVDIDLIDHVVLGTAGCDPAGRGYYSFRESGVL